MRDNPEDGSVTGGEAGPPPGPHEAGKTTGMDRDDRIALTVIAIVLGVVFIFILLGLEWLLSVLAGGVVAADGGVGFRSAFLTASGLSVLVMIVFAIVAGDGVVGEMPVMIAGFFLMLIFFTLSIALIF